MEPNDVRARQVNSKLAESLPQNQSQRGEINMKTDQEKQRDSQPLTLQFKVAFDSKPDTEIESGLYAFDARGKLGLALITDVKLAQCVSSAAE